jgi:hypothetical protein
MVIASSSGALTTLVGVSGTGDVHRDNVTRRRLSPFVIDKL